MLLKPLAKSRNFRFSIKSFEKTLSLHCGHRASFFHLSTQCWQKLWLHGVETGSRRSFLLQQNTCVIEHYASKGTIYGRKYQMNNTKLHKSGSLAVSEPASNAQHTWDQASYQQTKTREKDSTRHLFTNPPSRSPRTQDNYANSRECKHRTRCKNISRTSDTSKLVLYLTQPAVHIQNTPLRWH